VDAPWELRGGNADDAALGDVTCEGWSWSKRNKGGVEEVEDSFNVYLSALNAG
jgi:hypothetical protein